MRRHLKRRVLLLAVTAALVLAISLVFVGAALTSNRPPAPQPDWTQMLTYEQMTTMLQQVNAAYPDITKLYSIGHSWQERQLWCLELSAPFAAHEKKTGVAMFGNIHGGEQQGGMSAAYTAWWLATQYGKDKTATKLLRKYDVYIIPLINPDGYQQSFVYNTRQNMRPTDHNGDNSPFNDPYTDTNGDGVIAQIYQQTSGTPPADGTIVLGGNNAPTGYTGQVSALRGTNQNGQTVNEYESPDWNHDGIFGNDPFGSAVDMNRNFDYLWNFQDVTANPPLGANAWTSAGPDAASEPEVQAVQNFLIAHPVRALVTLHTGEQSVLWPWCYTPAPTTDNDFMKAVSEKMAAAWSATTGRGMYTLQSYDDYPTAAELIDWSWGRLHIHSYTQEVYAGGTGTYSWGNTSPQTQWIYMDTWQGQSNVWFKNSSSAQTTGKPVPEQDKLVAGVKDSFVQMAFSEPSGSGPIVPDWLDWGSRVGKNR